MPVGTDRLGELTRACAALVVASTWGCVAVRNSARVSSTRSAVQGAPAPASEYRIQPGDELDVKLYYNPELNEHLTVRPDGRISLQLVPETVAAGLTARELTERLKAEYARELATPELTVMVRTFSTQRIYVGGEVERPAEIRLTPSLTVLQAVQMAQGFKDTARLSEVILIRRNVDGTPLVIPVNLKRVIDGTDVRQDLTLVPFDVVYVPRSAIANVNRWVDQYLRKNIPISFGFRVDVPVF
jgi:protein involved in polysaccharide export with SLBB domain